MTLRVAQKTVTLSSSLLEHIEPFNNLSQPTAIRRRSDVIYYSLFQMKIFIAEVMGCNKQPIVTSKVAGDGGNGTSEIVV